MLEVTGLSACYGAARVLFDVSLRVGQGEVVVLLGRNGAGKSTTLKAVMGLLPSVSGEVRLGGRRIDGLAPFRVARLGLGYVPEDRRIFTDLTVAENLEVGRRPPRKGQVEWTTTRLEALFPNLALLRDRAAGRISGGEQQMVTIARTLMGNPTAILLDEPSEGLAPVIVEEMAGAIGALKREGLTVLLSEQNPYFAELVADRAYIIEKGHIPWAGTMAELARDTAARERYLAL